MHVIAPKRFKWQQSLSTTTSRYVSPVVIGVDLQALAFSHRQEGSTLDTLLVARWFSPGTQPFSSCHSTGGRVYLECSASGSPKGSDAKIWGVPNSHDAEDRPAWKRWKPEIFPLIRPAISWVPGTLRFPWPVLFQIAKVAGASAAAMAVKRFRSPVLSPKAKAGLLLKAWKTTTNPAEPTGFGMPSLKRSQRVLHPKMDGWKTN